MRRSDGYYFESLRILRSGASDLASGASVKVREL